MEHEQSKSHDMKSHVKEHEPNKSNDMKLHANHYVRLFAMIVLSFVSMYVFMYAMVNALGNVYPNLNQFYMAGIMTAPMVIIELLVMSGMYPDKKRNALILVASVAALALFWVGIRQQTAITDRQFYKSMIPHHAGAILMCEQSPSRDPEVLRLCQGIVSSQRAEIAQMKALLEKQERGGSMRD